MKNKSFKFLFLGVILLLAMLITSVFYLALETRENRVLIADKESYLIEKRNLEKYFAVQKDSINTLNLIIDSLDLKVNASMKEVVDLKSKLEKEQGRKFIYYERYEDLVKYFNDRYKVKTTEVIETKIGLEKSVASEISFELQKKDSMDSIIYINKEIITKQDTIIYDLSVQLDSKQGIIDIYQNQMTKSQDLFLKADATIDKLEEDLTKEQKKNKKTKWYVIIAVIVGIFAGSRT